MLRHRDDELCQLMLNHLQHVIFPFRFRPPVGAQNHVKRDVFDNAKIKFLKTEGPQKPYNTMFLNGARITTTSVTPMWGRGGEDPMPGILQVYAEEVHWLGVVDV